MGKGEWGNDKGGNGEREREGERSFPFPSLFSTQRFDEPPEWPTHLQRERQRGSCVFALRVSARDKVKIAFQLIQRSV